MMINQRETQAKQGANITTYLELLYLLPENTNIQFYFLHIREVL